MSIFKDSKSYRPFSYSWAVDESKRHAISMFWDVHQIDLSDDLRQYNTKGGLATENFSHEHNKRIIDTILFLFTEMDKNVAGGYIDLLPHTKNNEIRTLLLTQAQRETVHQRGYAILAESLGFSDKDWILFQTYKEMRDKLDVISGEEKDLSIPLNYAKALARLLLGEGIGLFASFVSLLNFKRFGLIMGFNDVNSWSLADETFHVENNIRILKEVINQDLSYAEKIDLKKYIENLVDKYIEVEINFIDLLGEQEDLSRDELKDYIRYLGELRLYQLDYIEIEKVRKSPLKWMDWILSGERHDNFFEKKVTDYSHGGLSGDVDYSKYASLLVN